MGELGEILTLLHDAADRSRPARLTVVERRHGARSHVAFERFMASHHPGRSYPGACRSSPSLSQFSSRPPRG